MSLLAVLIALAVLSVAVGFANALVAGYQVQKAQAVRNALESNRAYAQKLSEVITLYLAAVHRQLDVGADAFTAGDLSGAARQTELARLASRIEGVSTILLADAQGTVTARGANSPNALAAIHSLDDLRVTERRIGEWVRPCCQPDGGHATLTLVNPLPDGGALAAVVILERGSQIDKLIGQHPYDDGTQVYLVNSAGQALYSRDANTPLAIVPGNTPAGTPTMTAPGSAQVTDADGHVLLTGYAPLGKGKWAVVVQRPLDHALSPLKALLYESLRLAIPTVLLTLIAVSALAYAIARPLTRLTRALATPVAADSPGLTSNGPRAWYAEADALRTALADRLAQHRHEVGRLNTESLTDPMTGLMNRRAMRLRLDERVAAGTAFAIIALDVDHFKQINDTHGHPTGDRVLIALARTLSASVRQQDRPFRVGGEEFVVIVPDATEAVALAAAERIRAGVARTDMPPGVGQVTVSVGLALWPQDAPSAQAAVTCADQALYASKQNGRNRVTRWNTRHVQTTNPEGKVAT
ncbi:sensor domain-containing diguanylate cyclase [Achromobacter sp. ESBL13]|uniref:sensor domain-containing diguanylate cyclase n=1 Tax=Achromobacter sp. ESBL13 TaxID=3077328 RepID=UPI002FC63E95